MVAPFSMHVMKISILLVVMAIRSDVLEQTKTEGKFECHWNQVTYFNLLLVWSSRINMGTALKEKHPSLSVVAHSSIYHRCPKSVFQRIYM